MVRVFICPVIGTGAEKDPYRSSGADFGYQHANFIPSKADGTPLFAWALTVLVSADFTAIDADATCDDLFAGDLPAGINTRDDLRAFLRANTVLDVPLARRNAITAVLDKYSVDRTDFTGATPLWRVLQRVVSTLFQARTSELEVGFPAF